MISNFFTNFLNFYNLLEIPQKRKTTEIAGKKVKMRNQVCGGYFVTTSLWEVCLVFGMIIKIDF